MRAPETTCFATALAVTLAVFPSRALADDAPTYADRATDDADDDDAPDRRFAVLFNPLGAALGVYGGEIDFVVARKIVVGVEAAVHRVGATTARALGAGVQLFPFRSALHGFYLHPRFAYARAATDVGDGTTFDADVLGLGGTVGYQWTFDYGFSIRVAGGAMWFTDAARDPAQPRPALDGTRPIADASLGWAF
jgi:hypothetical protein